MHKIGGLIILLLTPIVLYAQAPPVAADSHVPLPGEKKLAPPYGMPITLMQADKVIAAAKAAATRLKSNVNVIAVVDTHGELVAFAKLDEATVHSIAYAQLKARGAARARRATFTPPLDMAAALATIPDFVSMPGGIPIVVGGKTVGAVGISGGNDLAIARAAVESLQPN
jgi:glc operon protein GlcG